MVGLIDEQLKEIMTLSGLMTIMLELKFEQEELMSQILNSEVFEGTTNNKH